MKAVAVLGSPRNDGNSTKIASTFLEACKANGYSTESYILNDLNFKGCQACMKCKTGSEKCVVSDGLTKVLEAIESADIIVLASPIYFGQISGQMKCFVDRTFSYLKPDFQTASDQCRLAPGIKCLFILTQGDTDPKSFQNVYTEYAEMYKAYGFEMHCIRGFGLNNKTEAETGGFLLEEAVDLANKLCKK